jgi:hypothetical protein
MMYTREFDRFSMKGETADDNNVIQEHIVNDVPLFVDDAGRVWNEGGQYIARYIEVEPGNGISC